MAQEYTCGNNCEICGKYTAVHYCGNQYKEYNCIVANKNVKIIYDENGNEEKREIY